MPLQGSWVEIWLCRYCQPGDHEFSPARNGVIVCSRCKKEELASGGTCMVCGIPGEFRARLHHVGGADSLVGRLCGPCRDDFRDRRSIGGWTIAEAS